MTGIEPSVSMPVYIFSGPDRPVQSFGTAQVINGDEAVAWLPDAKRLLIETVEGIKQVDLGNAAVSLFISGETHGIAISPSKTRLAFWDGGADGYTLKIVESTNKRLVHEWSLKRKYRGFPSGFQIGFSGDDTVYARTYDTESGTPLKRFDVTTGAVSEVASDCLSVASTENGIYHLGANTSGKTTLFKVQNGASLALADTGDYDTLLDDNNGRWLVLSNSKEPRSALLDTKSDKVVKELPGCDSMAVLADGSFLYARKNEIADSPSICQEH